MRYLIFILFIGCTPVIEDVTEDKPDVSTKVVEIAEGYIGHTEVTDNRSPLIDEWLRSVGTPIGNPWCAAFVSHVLDSAGAVKPAIRSARAQAFIVRGSIPATRVMAGRSVEPGTLIVWKRGDGVRGHVEVVKVWDGATGTAIGGNVRNAVRETEYQIIPTAYFRITHFTKVE